MHQFTLSSELIEDSLLSSDYSAGLEGDFPEMIWTLYKGLTKLGSYEGSTDFTTINLGWFNMLNINKQNMHY